MPASTIKEVNQECRKLLIDRPLLASIIDLWKELVFPKDWKLCLSGIADQKIMEFLSESLEVVNIEKLLQPMAGDYLTFGRFAATLTKDVTRGRWAYCVLWDSDYYGIKVRPNSEEPELVLYATQEAQDWATSSDPDIIWQRECMDPELLRTLQKGEVTLPQDQTIFMARHSHSTDFYGTSWLSSAADSSTGIASALLAGGIHVAALRSKGPFYLFYEGPAEHLRRQITNYVVKEKILTPLVEWHKYPMPTIEWLRRDYTPETVRRQIVQLVESTGIALDVLEGRQQQIMKERGSIAPI